MLVNLVHHGVSQYKRLKCSGWVQALVSHAEAEDLRYSVSIMQLAKQRSDDVVQARTQTAASNDARARPLRIKKQVFPRARRFDEGSSIRLVVAG
jgi:hypothetical protein